MATNSKDPSVVDLINAIERRLQKVHTQSLDLSFNELLDMYNNGELDISPDYQRLFQWSEGARSRFIESLMLEMPVPPIYVIEEEEGKYLLIDGLQRISSYLHLRGFLNASHLDPPVRIGDKLVLTDCDIVEELNGKSFDDLGTALQIRLKRAFVRVEVIRKGSDPRFSYHMFKRLNTGGILLTPQQLRNCTIRLLDPKFNDFIIDLSREEVFVKCTESLTQQHRLGAFDQELVLRFFAFKNDRDSFKHDVTDFFTEYMERISDPSAKPEFDYDREKSIFLKTFSVLDKTLGEYAFTYANPKTGKLTMGFSVYHFEAFTVGLQACLEKIDVEDEDLMKKMKTTFERIKLDPEFVKITTGGGKNSRGPLNARIEFVQKRVEAIL
jgi:uncharacterized protein with ParB-like and HNH nuclease domain